MEAAMAVASSFAFATFDFLEVEEARETAFGLAEEVEVEVGKEEATEAA